MPRFQSKQELYHGRLKTETELRHKENEYQLVATIARLQARLLRCPMFKEIAAEIGKSTTTTARRIYTCIDKGLLGRDDSRHRESTFVAAKGWELMDARGEMATNIFWGS